MRDIAESAAASIREGDLEGLKILLERDLELDEIVADEDATYTLLQFSAKHGRRDIFGHLLEQGADIGATGSDRASCAFLAVESGMEGADDLACLALDAGAGGSWTNDKGHTLAHVATDYHADKTLAKLLQLGLDPNVRDAQGCTPLHRAAADRMHAVLILFNAGADLEARDDRGRTPLQLASANCWAYGVHALRALGASAAGAASFKDNIDSCLMMSPLANAALSQEPRILLRSAQLHPEQDLGRLKEEIPEVFSGDLAGAAWSVTREMLLSLQAQQQTRGALALAGARP